MMVFRDHKKDSSRRKGATFHDVGVTILTPGCHFNGNLFCRGSSRIGGKIEGEIHSEGMLIIEEEANIIANIKADEAIIQGHVKGKLQASYRVELAANSDFEGDIVTPNLVINEGARFNGKSFMPSKHIEGTKNNATTLENLTLTHNDEFIASSDRVEVMEIT